VSSIIEQDGHKLYGVSYIVISFRRFLFKHDHPIEITNDRYGEYIESFAKRLSKEEAIKLLLNNADIDYKDYIAQLAREKGEVDQSIVKFVSEINKKKFKTRKVERIALDGSESSWNINCDPSLKDDIRIEREKI